MASTASAKTINVYTGYWVNWSQGANRGATITLTQKDAGVLIAFLAVFIGVVGRSFWRICCFIIHHRQSSATPQDGLYHQRQAILRNSTTSSDGLEMLMRVLWTWRKRARRPVRRVLPVSALAALIAGSFYVASLFSSHVTTSTRNEVLVNTNQCTQIASVHSQFKQALSAFLPYSAQRVRNYANRVAQCYRYGVISEDCHLYAQDRLLGKIERNASCPFPNEMCKTKTANIIMDSGRLNSLTHLGLNTAPHDQFEFRYVQHCAPLVTDGFKEIHVPPNMTADFGTARYFYGSTALNGAVSEPYTYQISLNSTFESLGDKTTTASWPMPQHKITAYTNYNAPGYQRESDFLPIPQLNKTSANTILIFRSSEDVSFVEPSDDLWFPAHTPGRTYLPQDDQYYSGGETQTFLQDEPASVLGCTIQEQFCYANQPNETGCEPLRAPFDHSQLDLMWPSTSLMARVSPLLDSSYVSTADAVKFLKSQAVMASDSLFYSVQGPVATDQWQHEVSYWFNITMASLQGLFLELASQPEDPALDPFRYGAKKPDDISPCNMLKIHSESYPSFSVLGVSIILSIGSLIIMLDMSLSFVVKCIQIRYKKDAYSRLEWCSNNTLQIQRLAHEEMGMGTWTGGDSGFPATEKGDTLAVLDISDPTRPMLMNPSIRRSRILILSKEEREEDKIPMSPLSTSSAPKVSVLKKDIQIEDKAHILTSPHMHTRQDENEISPVSPVTTIQDLQRSQTLVNS